MSTAFNPEQALQLGRNTLQIEAAAVLALAERIGQPPLAVAFTQAVQCILACRGRVVVSGMGKSGHIARKLAATLASTGTPAYFVHPAEASHGDLGMVTDADVFVALSNSGEVEELTRIVPLVKRLGAKLIAITGRADSTLARHADLHLDCAVEQEACPLNLAPTASTTAQLALGDALAVALLDARGFGPDDFARTHPGGVLGRKLLTHVADVMRVGDAVPRVAGSAPFPAALLEMTRKGLGMTAVVDDAGALRGVITDGDLRRLLERGVDLRALTAGQAMHPDPRTIRPDALAVEAVQMMEQYRINQMLVVDANKQPIGALNMHDLFAAKVV
ncbi:MAG: KpsF/GutQ family sugar-phosphate isomerase [Betaproteobacteria bacterium]|jgi:arabinose-5-phosphate isomerase|uniref:D-arabinose 5-phosphate isomerase n=1 Tax=Thiomonas delicata TaxID=364030 RepID=A0A238D107_THIDL|nr:MULTISPECIES: KpsF/GutQ family sugar-phosphate isomerase [Thiomonas]MDE2130743.1 KpsF/GutQ family sugar-phosphate isomerase [Betaproteobacteria bacterium]OZB45429.1 MAG: arabinose-5-phosphate isomerase [Thiomonas sp. 15-66-11]OZB54515.1 MAG: arabinose-5-phosphate isomerase [Thiomonas sp. 14-66-4]OZB63957.1 MAG: arabinose-5-phosphate isomerase [Thiomonas sp. 13-66-29]SBP86933.1 D-arabinose 5-phosphate isomerase [Thiomonas delicata]